MLLLNTNIQMLCTHSYPALSIRWDFDVSERCKQPQLLKSLSNYLSLFQIVVFILIDPNAYIYSSWLSSFTRFGRNTLLIICYPHSSRHKANKHLFYSQLKVAGRDTANSWYSCQIGTKKTSIYSPAMTSTHQRHRLIPSTVSRQSK